MANSWHSFVGNGSQKTLSLTFNRFADTEIKCEVNDIAVTNFTIVGSTGSQPNVTGGTFTFNNTGVNSDVCESDGAPKNGLTVLIYRSTDADSVKHTFTAGSSLKAAHLNANFIQLQRRSEESQGIYVRHSQIGDAAVESVNIKDGTIVNADINASAAVALSKLATGALPSAITVASANIVDGTIVAGDLGTNSVTTAKVLDNNITDAKISGLTSSKLTGALPALDGSNLTGLLELLDEDNFATDSATKAPSQQSVKAYIGTTNYTKAEADSRFYNLASVEEIQSGETWTAADDKVATTKAIDARVIDLVDDVGGFWPIANETSFPTANPDVNNGAGTIVSIKSLASAFTSSGSGVATIANGAGSGNTVTINGLANSTTYGAGTGMLVETTSTLHTYTFHRTTPNATEVTTVATNMANINTVATNVSNINSVAGNNTNITTVAGNNTNINTVAGANANITTVATNVADVNNFADLYQIANSAPGTDGGGNALAAGDLWFDSSSNKTLKVHNGTAFASVSPSQSVLDDISIVSGSLTRREDLGSVGDAIASDSSTGALDTCASNITNINTFANVYRIASSAPSSSLDEGDLWYDSTANVLKYYNGSAWAVTAAAGMSSLSDDTSPELAGNLDCNNKNFTEVGTVSGDNLQIDFGAIA